MTSAYTDLQTMVAAIRSGRQGATVAAIFDFGGALIDRPRPRHRPHRRHTPADVLVESMHNSRTEAEYRRILQLLSATLAGRTEHEVDELSRRIFQRTVYGYLYPEAWRLIRSHRAAGHTVVLISSLTRFHISPAAAHLGIEHVCCTPMATHDGILTGSPSATTLWGHGKRDAVTSFAAAHAIELEHSYAYAGTVADEPMLSVVGRPVVVNPDDALAEVADRRQWKRLAFHPRRPPRARDYARTAAGFVGLFGGAFVGVASKALTGNRQHMADALMVHAAGYALRATGVRVRVTGAEHAMSPRPAVFLFNHQSQFDIVVLPAALGGGMTGIGKRELTKNPVFGPLLRFVGLTFIDRANTAHAKAALQPVVDTLRAGLSIVVSPEGTRSYTPEVGPFKKGAFHIAIQAEVPVIPVVIRNAGEICWRNAMVARRGTVDVAILDPIDVSGWDPADMDDRVAKVRQLFLDTLLDWPR
ncbi:HAD-IB family hydrolase [Nocardia sp. CNY236]|uniref:HAD-IB family hydrolase n=1 Tax=Nocardia sp. CNY236 TaxID=1169152 RepID=UPI00041DF238|nr:HAD-IB family hydrolase [Nocardia sp. CNY236]